jgi:pilus assembly protein CpaF
MNSQDNTGERLMNEQENPQVDVYTRILNKVLANLYLTIAPAHPPRVEELAKIDSERGIERPSALEIHRAIKELVEFDRDLGNGMRFRIIEELLFLDKDLKSEGRIRIEEQFNRVLFKEKLLLTDAERQRLFESITAEILGLGPLEPLLADGAVTAIMVDGYNKVYVDKQRGKLEDTPYRFRDNDHLMAVIGRIFGAFGPLRQHPDESFPIVDVRMSDGSRVNVVMPPISLIGPVMTIQAFEPYRGRFTVENLIHYGSGSPEIFEFLKGCVRGRLNIGFAGGPGTGKTMLMRVIAEMIPNDERIITIASDATILRRLAEARNHVITLEGRPPNREGAGEITVQDLFINALRMRADRIILGGLQGPEVMDMLQAIDTGHDGTMFTIHAGDPRDALTRLEMMATSANPMVPLLNVRQKMAATIDLIVTVERLHDGSRKILKVSEVTGMQGDFVGLQDIFEFRETGVDEAGRVVGHFAATGHIPKFMDRIQAAGVDLSLDLFTPQ